MSNKKFPIYDYPYTFRQKMDFYAKKITCRFILCAGTGIYAKISIPLLDEFVLDSKSIDELNVLKREIKISSPLGILIGTLGIAILSYCAKYRLCDSDIGKNYNIDSYFDKKTVIALSIAPAILAVSNFYRTMIGVYNSIKINLQFTKRNHELQVLRSIRAVTNELKNMEQLDICNIHHYTIKNSINNKKLEWQILKFESDDRQTYVVYNGYYEELFFVFDVESTAEKFCTELTKLSIEHIDSLSRNKSHAMLIQKEFIQDCLFEKLLHNHIKNNI